MELELEKDWSSSVVSTFLTGFSWGVVSRYGFEVSVAPEMFC